MRSFFSAPSAVKSSKNAVQTTENGLGGIAPAPQYSGAGHINKTPEMELALTQRNALNVSGKQL